MNTAIKKVFFASVLFIGFVLVAPSRVAATTTIGQSAIVGDTVWKLSGSPYILSSQLKISNGATLTIEPGVTVMHTGDFSGYDHRAGIVFEANSRLLALGTSAAPIRIDDMGMEFRNYSVGDIAHASLLNVFLSSSSIKLNGVTMTGFEGAVGSVLTLNDVTVRGDPLYMNAVNSGSRLGMSASSIDNPYPNIPAALSFSGAEGALLDTVLSSVTVNLHAYGNSNVRIAGGVIKNSPEAGILLTQDVTAQEDGNHLQLDQVEIAANKYGIKISGRPRIEAGGNSIHGNQFGVTYAGADADSDDPFSFPFAENWWGDATGPYQSATNTAGKGDEVSKHVTYAPWLPAPAFLSRVAVGQFSHSGQGDGSVSIPVIIQTQSTQAAAPKDPPVHDIVVGTPQQKPVGLPAEKPRPLRSPVVIVPGVLGTELGGPTGKLWLDFERTLFDVGDQFMDPLRFKADLTPADAGVTVGEVIGKKTGLAGAATLDYSDALVKQLEAEGYRKGADLFLFAYDWRYGASASVADQLRSRISDIRAQTGSPKVDIVAHSMGGLVVKKYVSMHPDDGIIGKAVFVGVPNLGAPQAIKNLILGSNFGMVFLSEGEVRKISKNLPAMYDLAPSAKYHAVAGGYYATINPKVPGVAPKTLSHAETNALLVKSYEGNEKAIANATALHSEKFDGYDMRKAGIDLYAINGCKSGTFGGMTEASSVGSLGNLAAGYGSIREVSGDGTVPLQSAASLPIDSGHSYYALKSDHPKMLGQDGIRQQIANILTGGKLPVSADAIAGDAARCGLSGRLISIYSPLSIQATDAEGRRVGLADDGEGVDIGIPNADYQVFGDHKFLYLPTDEGQTYDIALEGTGEGTFTLSDAIIEGDAAVSAQVFERVPVTTSLKGKLVMGTASALELDTDGDGSVDATVAPTRQMDAKEANEYYPPETASEPAVESQVSLPAAPQASPSPKQEADPDDVQPTESILGAAAIQSGVPVPRFAPIMFATVLLFGGLMLARRKLDR